jgi:undecaprenyl diphosphate synthase
MELFFSALQDELSNLKTQHIQLRFIGDRSRFSEKLHQKMSEAEELTRHHHGMILILAVDYGGQWDICQAVSQLVKNMSANKLPISITPEAINQYLSFADLPNPDLFIRTSGEIRISNFMLWQLAYSELYFTDILWPDFNEEALDEALLHFSRRERRYGSRDYSLDID